MGRLIFYKAPHLCAYYLVEAGLKPTLIDGRTVALGSTCASTSLLQYEIDTPLTLLSALIGEKNAARSYLLCLNALEKLSKLVLKIGFNDFTEKHSFQFASYQKDKDLLNKEYAIRKRWNIDIELLNEKDILNTFKFKAPAGLLSKNGAQTDAYLLTHKILQYLIKKGIQVYDRTPIIEFHHSKNGVRLVTANNFNIKAKKVIYATGYESVNLINKNILKLKSTYVIASEQFSHANFWAYHNCMIWETAHPYLYLRTTNDTRIIIGGKDVDFYNATRRDNLLKSKKAVLERSFNQLFPEIQFKTEFSWCGTFSKTKDGLPYIGNYSNMQNSYIALGFGGNGITFSVISAEIIRDILLGKKNSDAALFKFNR
ncbi:NAD(P)/FAD-dependent oxidoreductase [Solitalea lacus]|uniref:NAD(P)/FAD-dependent oxidoreductase n=1 Tax=Solitalea lacus TaxID=2911172 RepID=UPI001ED9DAC4|nr:FAD-dependent oxidoreductase [Solitalea lacus]UKJ08532.1 FAD-binding oxidoreductase [Solitalea lacus]